MTGGTLKYKDDDEDEYGVPRRLHNTSRPSLMLQLRRYRSHILIVAIVLLFVYWPSGQKDGPTEWSRFAYVQYATDPHSMCNAYMVFEALKRHGSKADRVLMYPEEWQAERDDPDDRNSQLMIRAKQKFDVKLKPIQVIGIDGPADAGTLKQPSGWQTSITKLRAFEQDEYDRVLLLDSDITLQQHMDELFLLPSTPIAMPRAYYLDLPPEEWPLSTVMMLIDTNPSEIKHMYERLQEWRLDPDRTVNKAYDLELINERFYPSAMVLPHRPYMLTTSEFRRHDHRGYLGSYYAPETYAKWDPFKAVKEAKVIHFRDSPLPKPWMMWPIDGLAEIQPDCGGSHTGTCADREVWKNLYDDFRRRRKELCSILSVPAPQSWQEWKNLTKAD